MRVLISGASGLVGSALVPSLEAAGHRVRRLVRQRCEEPDAAFWDPAAGTLDAGALDGVDAVVHLAGESIAAGRWSAEVKRRILESRVEGTGLIAEELAALEAPPALVAASAIGYYGDRGVEPMDEESPSGEGFLAEVCRRWEAAAQPARDAGSRVVHLRIGMVLSRRGGALQRMLTPFKLGLGGTVGDGRQFMSWIHLDDLVAVIEHALADGELAGAVNAVAPQPVSNREFTRTLGRVLGRPTLVPVPAPLVRLAFGEMGSELLLASTRVVPARLEGAGFAFRFPELEAALAHELGR